MLPEMIELYQIQGFITLTYALAVGEMRICFLAVSYVYASSATTGQRLNCSHLSGREGGPCPRLKADSHSPTNKHFDLRS
jgi:hypothetical protein